METEPSADAGQYAKKPASFLLFGTHRHTFVRTLNSYVFLLLVSSTASGDVVVEKSANDDDDDDDDAWSLNDQYHGPQLTSQRCSERMPEFMKNKALLSVAAESTSRPSRQHNQTASVSNKYLSYN